MKNYYIEESGYYKIRVNIDAENEEDAVDRLYDELPMYINIEADDREITEWKSDENK